MASKVNTKFVLILVIAIGVAGTLAAGTYVLIERNNTQRNVKRAAEAEAAGDYEKAFGYYGRAAHKDPANIQLLDKLDQMLLKLTAETEHTAGERYYERLQILRQAARHTPTDAERHLRVLRELHSSGRIFNYQTWFVMMGQAADEMWSGVPDFDARRGLAKCYRAISRYRLADQRTTDELIESEHEVQGVVDAMPDNDFAWANLAMMQMAIIEKYRSEGRSRTALDEQYRRVNQTLLKATQAVPEGTETAYAQLRFLDMKRAADPSSVSSEELIDATNRLAENLSAESDPGFLAESIELIAGSTAGGLKISISLLKDYLAAHPSMIYHRIRYARFLYAVEELEAAEREAESVLQSEPLPTSFIAQMQFGLKREAAALVADIANRRWTIASDEDKPQLLKSLEAARDKLAAVVARPTDPQLLRADGKIAYAKGDYNRAASLFEQVLQATTARGQADRETLLYAAECLERIGNVGRAHEYLSQLMQSSPGAPDWIRAKAQMEYRMGRYDAAAATLANLPQADLEKPEVREMIAEIKRRKESPIKLHQEDPVFAALDQANSAMLRGAIDDARSVLLSALNASPDNLQILQVLAQVEMRDGRKEEALTYVERALKVAPDDPLLKRIDIVLKSDDPIDAIEQYHRDSYDDEFVRSLSLAATLAGMRRQQEAYAKYADGNDDAEAAAKARALAERASAKSAEYERRATELNPDSSDLIEYKFLKAVDAKDWEQAEHFVSRARSLNSDQANGLFYRGRLEFFKGNYTEAVRALEGASDKLNYSSHVWRALAAAYQNLKNESQALRAFEQAYKCNPNDVLAAKAYVSLLLRRNEHGRALAIMRPLRQLVPQDSDVRNMWLELELQAGDRAMAIRTRRNLLRDQPHVPANAIRLAQLLATLTPTRELIVDAQGNPLVSDSRWERMTLEERESYITTTRDQWRKEADSILQSVLATPDEQMQPSSGNATPAQWKLAAVSARANLMREQGKFTEGENALREFISARTNDDSVRAQMLIELGRYQALCNHFTEAFDTLKEALKHQDPKVRGADQELASLYFQLNLNNEAIKHINELIANDPDNPKHTQLKAECLLKLGQVDESEQLIRNLIKAKGDDYISIMLLATIAQVRGEQALGKGDTATAERMYAEQREALLRAEAQEPQEFKASVLLAHSWMTEYRRTQRREALDEALRVLDRAERAAPGQWEVLFARLAVMREKRQQSLAIGDLKKFIEKQPDHVAARRELVQLHIEAKDNEAAIAAVDEAIRRNPTLVVWHEAKGDLYRVAKRDIPAAILAYEKADDLSPRATTLAKYVETALMMPQPRCADLIKRLRDRENDLATVPYLREAYARVLMCDGRRDEALEQARLAYLRRREIIASGQSKPQDIGPWYEVLVYLFPTQSGAVDASAAENFLTERCNPTPDIWDMVSISRMWFLAGDGKRAIEVQQRAIAQCPPDNKSLRARFTLDLANTYLALGEHEYAAAAYHQALEIEPDNMEALNNVSYLLAESMGNPGKALPFAQRAAHVAPGNPAVLDTLGWTHFLAGHHDKAKQYLEEAVAIDDSAVGVVVHLAEVLLALKDFDGAQRQLDHAVRFNPDPATQQKIDKLKDDIRKGNSQPR